MTFKSVHGHVIASPSHVMFVGRNTRERVLVVIFRQGRKAYVYRLGDSYHPNLCCKIAQLPEPGGFISKELRKFPTESIE